MSAKNHLFKIKNIFVIIIILSMSIFAVYMFFNESKKIKISSQVTNDIYYIGKIKEKDIVSFEWEHSFEHIAWNEYYKVNEENGFDLYTIAVEGFGAGIPAEMDCTYRYVDGLIYMENIKGSTFKEFNWINSQKQLKKILINNKLIVEGGDLPERGRINMRIE